MTLSGKTALVTGVTNRFSLAWGIARALADGGARLLLTYQGERLERAVTKLAAEIDSTRTATLDVTDDDQIDAVFVLAERELGGIDIVVHSIAYAPAESLSRPFIETSRAAFASTLEISAYSLTALARRAAPQMAARGGGSLLALTYLGGERVIPNYNVMGVAKAALDMSMRYLAADLGPKNIRVNAISAGPVSTAASRGISGFLSMQHHVIAASPLRRAMTTAEIGAAAAFLCSDAARGITGEVLHVDGGYNVLGTTIVTETASTAGEA